MATFHHDLRGRRHPLPTPALLAGGFERVSQRARCLRHRAVGRNDGSQALTRPRAVELVDGRVEVRPQLMRSASPGARTQLIRRPRALRPLDRTPRKPRLKRASMRIAHRRRSLRQLPQPTAKARIGWRQLMRAHCGSPRRLRLARRPPRLILCTRRTGPTTSLRNLAHGDVSYRMRWPGARRALGATRCFRKNPTVAKTYTRTHTVVLM
jgi:hypothetical protein